jgi:hypothetical protein
MFFFVALISTSLYYASISWALNRFTWVLLITCIVGGVTSLLGPLIYMMVYGALPQLSVWGVLDSFILGIALRLGARYRT